MVGPMHRVEYLACIAVLGTSQELHGSSIYCPLIIMQRFSLAVVRILRTSFFFFERNPNLCGLTDARDAYLGGHFQNRQFTPCRV